jgi:hypothetical protein
MAWYSFATIIQQILFTYTYLATIEYNEHTRIQKGRRVSTTHGNLRFESFLEIYRDLKPIREIFLKLIFCVDLLFWCLFIGTRVNGMIMISNVDDLGWIICPWTL